MEWAADELGMDPLIAALSSNAIAGAIEGILEDGNAVRGIFDSAYKAGTGFLTLGGTGVTSWEQAAYIAQVQDFTRILKQDGIGQAMETYAAGYFHQTTIDSIWKMGGIYDLLVNPNQVEITTNGKGEQVKRIYLSEIKTEEDKNTANFIDLSLNGDRLMGRREGNVTEHCEYSLQPDGTEKLWKGEQEYDLGNGFKRIDVVEGYKTVKSILLDSEGNQILILEPRDGTDRIKYDYNNNPTEFKITEGYSEDFEIQIKAFEQNGTNEGSGEIIFFDKNTDKIALIMKVDEGIPTFEGNIDKVGEILIEMGDELASQLNPKYALVSNIAKLYNTFVNMYNDTKQSKVDDTNDNFRVAFQALEGSTDIERDVINGAWIDGKISNEEYKQKMSFVDAEYERVLTILETNRNESINNIQKIYLEFNAIPLIGDFDEN
ncbi:MAG: hypothetical protein ABIH85_07345 [Candidatus Omnitrophota bacterium]